MRHKPTEAEAALWTLLRDRRFSGFKFRRQVPIGPYIVDFLCSSAKLIVELDGSQHADNARDAARDGRLAAQRFRLPRIWNSDLILNRAGVFDAVWANLQEKS